MKLKWHRDVLNLDSGFIVRGGFDVPYKHLDFLGGEPHLQLDVEEGGCYDDLLITQRYNTPKDLMMVLLANDAAKRAGFSRISLYMPYFPAARQDRVCNFGEPLSVKVFADMINSCGFQTVYIYSPHSDVTPALLNNVKVVDFDSDLVLKIFLKRSLDESSFVNIVCPDAGAAKRVSKISKDVMKDFPNINLIRCEKVRDVSTGQLKEFHVQAEDLGGHFTIILDDINSMGGTFIGLGKVLKKKNCGELCLFTSHSDCHEGICRVCDSFDWVYTTNSKSNWDWSVKRTNFGCFPIDENI